MLAVLGAADDLDGSQQDDTRGGNGMDGDEE